MVSTGNLITSSAVIQLTKIQRSDNEQYIELQQQIRNGTVTENNMKFLIDLSNAKLPAPRKVPTFCVTNRKRYELFYEILQKLPEAIGTFLCLATFHAGKKIPLSQKELNFLSKLTDDKLDRIQPMICLCINAPVLIAYSIKVPK